MNADTLREIDGAFAHGTWTWDEERSLLVVPNPEK